MQVPMNGCCVGGPVVDQRPITVGAMLVLVAIFGAGALIVVAVTAAML